MSLFNFVCHACVFFGNWRKPDARWSLLEEETPSADKIWLWSISLQRGKESRAAGIPDGKSFIEYPPPCPNESASLGNQKKSSFQVLYYLLVVFQEPNYCWLVA